MQPQSLVHSARFRAVARIRPTLVGEPSGGGYSVSPSTTPRQHTQHTLQVEGCTVRVGVSNPHDYTLDAVLDERDPSTTGDDPQGSLFYEVGSPMVSHAIGGYNTCILAYGQSGSGKTHTTIGTPQEEGILPRMLRALVANNNNTMCGTSLDVSVSILELYNEIPSCLYTKYEADGGSINKSIGSGVAAGLCSVRESPTEGPYVEGLRRVVVTPATLEASIAHIHRVLSNSRRVGGTTQNVRSSRSHVLCTIHRAHHEILEEGAEGNPLGTSPICVTTSSKTCIVDLAGSERVGQHANTNGGGGGSDTTSNTNTPRGFGEGVAINQSLLTLGLVINAVADTHCAPHTTAVPPFRNSKLTYILKDALRGEALTAVVATLQPNGSFTDLTDTLRFASRCASIKAMVRRCRRLDVSSQRASELAAENLILKQQLARMTEAFAQQQITATESQDAASSPLPDRSVSISAKDAWLGLTVDHNAPTTSSSLDVAAPPRATPSTSRAPYYSRDGIQYRLPYLGVSSEYFLLPIAPLPLTSERCGDRTLAYTLEDRVGAVRVLSARFVAPEEFLGMVPSSASEEGAFIHGDPNSVTIPFPQLINTPTASAAICWVKTEVGRNTGGEVYHTLEVPPSGALLFKVSVDGCDCDDSNRVYPLQAGSTITLVHSASLYTVVFRYVSPAHPTRTASQSLPPAPSHMGGIFGDRGDSAVVITKSSAHQEGWNNLDASPVRRYLLDACIAQPNATSPTRRLHTDTSHTSHRRPHRDLVSSDDDGTPEGSDTDRSFSMDTDTVSEGSLNATPAPLPRPTPKRTGNSPPQPEKVPAVASPKDILANVPLPPQVRRWGRSVRLVEEYVAAALSEAYEAAGGQEVEEDAVVVGDALIAKWRSATRPNECQALQGCIHDSCAELYPPFCTGPDGAGVSLLRSTLEAGGSAQIKALLRKVQEGGSLDKKAARQCCESLLARHLYLVDGWWLWVARELNNDADTPDRKDDVTVRIFVRRNTSNLSVLPSNPTEHHLSLFLSECVSEDYTTYPLPPRGFDTPSMVFAVYLLRRMLQVQSAIPTSITAPFDLRCRTVVTKVVEAVASLGGRSHSQSGELSAPPSPSRPDTAILPVRWHDWNYSSVADLHGANMEVLGAYHTQCTSGRGGVEHARLVAKSLQLAASLEDAEQEVSSAGMRIREGQSALHTTTSQLYDETQQLRHQLAVRETMVAQGVQRADELEAKLAKAVSTQRMLEATIQERDEAAQFATKQKASLEQRLVVSQLELSRMLVLRQEVAKDQDASERSSVVGRGDSSPILSHAASSSSLHSKRVFQRISPPALTQSNLSSLRPAEQIRAKGAVSRSSSMSAASREPAQSPRVVRAVDTTLKAPSALRPQSASSARRTASSGSAHHQHTHRSGVAAGSMGPEVVLPRSHDSAQRNRVMLSGHRHRDPHSVPLTVSEEQQRVHDECSPEPAHHQLGDGDDARSRFVLVEEKEEVERQLQQYKMASASKDAEVRGLHEALDQMEARHGDKERHWVAMMDGYDTTIRTLTLELDRLRELAIAKERARIRGKRAAEKPTSTPVVSKVAQQLQSTQHQHPPSSSSTQPINHPLPPSVIEQRSAEVRKENRLLQKEVTALRLRIGEMGVRMEGAARQAR